MEVSDDYSTLQWLLQLKYWRVSIFEKEFFRAQPNNRRIPDVGEILGPLNCQRKWEKRGLKPPMEPKC